MDRNSLMMEAPVQLDQLQIQDDERRRKFSDYITSPVLSVMVGTGASSTLFFVHSELLIKESYYFRNLLRVQMSERLDGNAHLEEVDPDLFRYFVQYLYRDGWLYEAEPGVQFETDFILLARLFSLGEYLQADTFRMAASAKFRFHFCRSEFSNETICNLLEIACTQLQERNVERGTSIRVQILVYAANNLSRLTRYEPYQDLLKREIEVGRCIAGTIPDEPQTAWPAKRHSNRFAPESLESIDPSSNVRIRARR